MSAFSFLPILWDFISCPQVHNSLRVKAFHKSKGDDGSNPIEHTRPDLANQPGEVAFNDLRGEIITIKHPY